MRLTANGVFELINAAVHGGEGGHDGYAVLARRDEELGQYEVWVYRNAGQDHGHIFVGTVYISLDPREVSVCDRQGGEVAKASYEDFRDAMVARAGGKVWNRFEKRYSDWR